VKFSTHLLDEAIAKKKADDEKARLQYLEKVFAALCKLSKEIDFKEAYIFGSLAKPFSFSPGAGGFGGCSDIDIGFAGLRDEDFFKAAAFLSSELEIDVDVVQLEGHRLEEKIKREGIKWTG